MQSTENITDSAQQLAREIYGMSPGSSLEDYASLIARHVATVTAEKDKEIERLRERLKQIAAKLEEAVCTEDPDKGVVLLSDHGTTHAEHIDGRDISVYDHEYFSPLGDALIAAWHLTQEMENQK